MEISWDTTTANAQASATAQDDDMRPVADSASAWPVPEDEDGAHGDKQIVSDSASSSDSQEEDQTDGQKQGRKERRRKIKGEDVERSASVDSNFDSVSNQSDSSGEWETAGKDSVNGQGKVG